MYKIIGSDGKEYGPITLDQLKQWFSEGRVNAQTQVLPEGTTEWVSAGQLPELASAAPPPPAFQPPSPQHSDNAASMVKGPAIFILVVSILDLLTAILNIILTAVGGSTLFKMPGMSEQDAAMQEKIMLLFGLPANIFAITVAAFCIFASIRMMKLQSFGLAMTCAVLTLIPCGTCCCFLNLGAGIWALVVLNKPDIKAAFH
jgi:hypothetical protein